MSNPFAVQPAFTAQPELARPGGRDNADGGDFAAVMESESRRDDTGRRTEQPARGRDRTDATKAEASGDTDATRSDKNATRERGTARERAGDGAERADTRESDTENRKKADADGRAADAQGAAGSAAASAANASDAGRGDGADPRSTQGRGEKASAVRQAAAGPAQAAKARPAEARPAEAKQAEAKPAEAKQAEAKQAEAKQARAGVADAQRLRAADLQRLAEGEARDRQLAGQPVKVTVTGRTGAVRPGGPISGATAFAATSVAQRTAQAREAVAGDLSGKADRARADKAGDARPAGSLRAEAASRAAQAAARPQTAAAVEGVARAGLDGQAGQQLPQQGATGESARLAQELAAGTTRSGGEATGTPSATTTTPTASAGTQSQVFDPVMQSITTPGQGGGQTTDGTGAARGAEGQAQAQARSMPAQPVQEQVAVQLNRAVANGQSRLSMRLHPADLGRIDVKLDMNDDGSVRATLSVEKPETLDLMQRDVRSLEKALNDAGLKTDDGSLSFNLGDQGDNPDDDEEPGFDNTLAAGDDGAGADGEPAEAVAAAEALVSATAVNLRI